MPTASLNHEEKQSAVEKTQLTANLKAQLIGLAEAMAPAYEAAAQGQRSGVNADKKAELEDLANMVKSVLNNPNLPVTDPTKMMQFVQQQLIAFLGKGKINLTDVIDHPDGHHANRIKTGVAAQFHTLVTGKPLMSQNGTNLSNQVKLDQYPELVQRIEAVKTAYHTITQPKAAPAAMQPPQQKTVISSPRKPLLNAEKAEDYNARQTTVAKDWAVGAAGPKYDHLKKVLEGVRTKLVDEAKKPHSTWEDENRAGNLLKNFTQLMDQHNANATKKDSYRSLQAVASKVAVAAHQSGHKDIFNDIMQGVKDANAKGAEAVSELQESNNNKPLARRN